MKKYQVFWTDVAERDLIGIVDFMAAEKPGTARKVLLRLKQNTAGLFSMPEEGRIVPELLEHGISQYREMIVAPWRIIYKMDKRKVLVFAVIDGRRNIEDVLLRRMIDLREEG